MLFRSANYHLTDEQFIEEWNRIGSPLTFAKLHGMTERSVYNRRRSLEVRLGITLPSFKDTRFSAYNRTQETVGNTRRQMNIEKGRVIVFSDAHFWPDQTTTAFKALLECIKEYKPTAIVCNGDALDGASIKIGRAHV